MSLEEYTFLSVLKENEEINSEAVEIILKELNSKLIKSTEQLNEVKRRNLPRIKEIQKEKKELIEEIERLKGELNELNSIKPISILEKRRNDFKTEGEYISKILNRNIKEEFYNQMKKELRAEISFKDEKETIDQVLCTAIPGCDELNEKLDEMGIEGILISQKIEKILTILNVCHYEIVNKVFKDGEAEEQKEKLFAFETFCFDLIGSFFKSRFEAKINSLPQYFAISLNDFNVTILFLSIKFKKSVWKLKKLFKSYFENFLREQKEEISTLISSDFNVKSMKKVALFLSRLEKVLKPLMLKFYFENMKFILLNFAQEIVWKNLMELSDISVDEIENLSQICRETIKLDEKGTMKFNGKLKCYERILNMSLIEIINSYRRREFKEISDEELSRIIKAVFASTSLRNEFIKELELEKDDDYELYASDEEYF